jgi:hypothetical protein
VAAKQEQRNWQHRHDKQRAIRWELEMHLKELYRDYMAIKQTAAVQTEDLARLIADNKRLYSKCQQHAAKDEFFKCHIQEKQHLLTMAKVCLQLYAGSVCTIGLLAWA